MAWHRRDVLELTGGALAGGMLARGRPRCRARAGVGNRDDRRLRDGPPARGAGRDAGSGRRRQRRGRGRPLRSRPRSSQRPRPRQATAAQHVSDGSAEERQTRPGGRSRRLPADPERGVRGPGPSRRPQCIAGVCRGGPAPRSRGGHGGHAGGRGAPSRHGAARAARLYRGGGSRRLRQCGGVDPATGAWRGAAR